MIAGPQYAFIKHVGALLNAGQTRTVLLTGEVHDAYFSQSAGDYVSLIDCLLATWGDVRGKILVVYELNGPIRFAHATDKERLAEAWVHWRTGMDAGQLAIRRMLMTARERAQLEEMGSTFDSHLKRACGNPSVALELLRQFCICSRSRQDGKPLLDADLLIVVEGADLLLPEGEIARLSDADRHRVAVCQDWFSDPDFMRGGDAVVLVAESASQVHARVARLPQVLQVQIPAPDEHVRSHFIAWFNAQQPATKKPRLWSSTDDLARLSAGLSVHALRQLLLGAVHDEGELSAKDVVAKVEDHVQKQLGDDVVAFKKPNHTLDDVVGFERLKAFLREELIPRFRARGSEALPGAAVCGPIGVGKTFIFEAVASELDVVVLVLKSIRSKWFGETDVLLERLRRVLAALDKVVIFVDEADTQFGGVGAETHSTERRLTGKIQAMMSDPRSRGRVIWLLMTARIHLLSPDIRRPGRVGDLIIPVLDPEGSDRDDFCRWMVKEALEEALDDEGLARLREATADHSAAGFASLRSELLARASGGKLSLDRVLEIIADHIPPALADVRRYQTLQALASCTRRSLLPKGCSEGGGADERGAWFREIRALEAKGIH